MSADEIWLEAGPNDDPGACRAGPRGAAARGPYSDVPRGADRGALMVYRTEGETCDGWYAGTKKRADGHWAFADTRGISARELAAEPS